MGSGGNGIKDLPDVVYVRHFAGLLQISPRALRQRAARGQVPRPFRLGKALAWTRDTVVAWLRDFGRSAGPSDMKINLRRYTHDKSRWHVDIRIMNPCDTEREIRKRMVAPAGMSEAQARTWGEDQVPKILRKVLGAPPVVDAKASSETEVSTKKISTNGADERGAARRSAMTLGDFYAQRFEPEHLLLQKPGTQVSYETNFRNHIAPVLGDLPLEVIDEDRLSSFRAGLRRSLSVRTVNLVLTHLAKMLRFAKKLRYLEAVPEIEKLPVPRSRPKEIYSDEEIEKLLIAAASIDSTMEVFCLLALDAGMRISEICALRWGDVDFELGVITVQHNVFRGQTQTPKGTIGKVALSSALREALSRHRRQEPIGPLVLYRRDHRDRSQWRAHSRCSLTHLLNRMQRMAGLRLSGPHLLRHTALTRLSNLGASVYVLQAVARHSHLQTTQTYIHTQGRGRTVEAAELLDQAASRRVAGKSRAKLAKTGKK